MTAVASPAGRAPARGMNKLDSLSEHMLGVLRRGGADLSKVGVPVQPAPEDGLWEDVSVPQARARRNAWHNSIEDAAQEEYLQFRFANLDPYQKPDVLSQWLDSLVEAKQATRRAVRADKREWLDALATGTARARAKDSALRVRPSVLNMIIPGTIGAGKSAMACALGNEAVGRGLAALYVKHSTYLTWRMPDSAPHNLKKWEVREMFVECDVLVLDELCDMDDIATSFARRETIDLIDSRISSGRPTVYTTNAPSRGKGGALGVVDVLGEKLLSRLEESAHVLKTIAPDRRKPAKPLDW
ncbi:AAA-ATPase [Streptomyces phage Gilgamesh]|uniref:AAA-ATPase n=1 Tax=Streptomyces phage Gilgamesh TaxID=2599890 RepID=A0A5J6TXR3_9CAUD|nr:AAA-ATPase [Streptomyces phage Gilgamesh]QFG13272.1 AAA-ATPase [Streptomyces phage Gilgamesh]